MVTSYYSFPGKIAKTEVPLSNFGATVESVPASASQLQ